MEGGWVGFAYSHGILGRVWVPALPSPPAPTSAPPPMLFARRLFASRVGVIRFCAVPSCVAPCCVMWCCAVLCYAVTWCASLCSALLSSAVPMLFCPARFSSVLHRSVVPCMCFCDAVLFCAAPCGCPAPLCSAPLVCPLCRIRGGRREGSVRRRSDGFGLRFGAACWRREVLVGGDGATGPGPPPTRRLEARECQARRRA